MDKRRVVQGEKWETLISEKKAVYYLKDLNTRKIQGLKLLPQIIC